MGARALACAGALVALLIQHATRRHIVIRRLCGATIFLEIINCTIFGKKVAEYKMCFDLSRTFI
jgi:hypothetical protein